MVLGPITQPDAVSVPGSHGSEIGCAADWDPPCDEIQLTLDDDQVAMVRTLASSGAGVDVVVGKAGTGKSTALGAYRSALDAAGIPVIGVAPSATAAQQLAVSAGITDTATVDRLLVELDHRRRTLPRGAVVVLDEAAMCSTRKRLALQRAVDAVNGKIGDVGDHRQIPSVAAGGGHYAALYRMQFHDDAAAV